MKKQWFVYHQEQVSGPLTAEEIQESIQAGLFFETSLVWGKGMPYWLRASQWNADLSELLNKSEAPKNEQQWYYAHEGHSHGPLTRINLMQKMNRMDDVKDVLLWTKGLQNWLPIIEFHDFMEELGLNRREFPRAPLTGEVFLVTPDGEAKSNLLSISSGGFGMRPALALQSGDQVQVRIVSSLFPAPLKVSCEVKYISSSNYAGLQFLNLGSEAQSKIVEYVQSFLSRTDESKAA